MSIARRKAATCPPTFSHQSAYLAPLYPFHVELPEFPTVKTPTCSDEQRARNLEQMQKISGMARQRRLHFSLGVWQLNNDGSQSNNEPLSRGQSPAGWLTVLAIVALTAESVLYHRRKVG